MSEAGANDAPAAPAGPRLAEGASPPAPVPGVGAALAELAMLESLPVDEHADVYERAHLRLQDAMADADEA